MATKKKDKIDEEAVALDVAAELVASGDMTEAVIESAVSAAVDEALAVEELPKTTAMTDVEWNTLAKAFIQEVWDQFRQGRFSLTREQMESCQKLLS